MTMCLTLGTSARSGNGSAPNLPVQQSLRIGEDESMSIERPATLRGGAPRHVDSVRSAVLVLHGGREHSRQPTSSRQLAVLRMVDMYAGLRRQSIAAAVYLLRHRVRGWNPGAPSPQEPDPVRDARWALAQIRSRYGALPIVLLGHSMGGRTAFAVADDPNVVGVCALAPWLPPGEPLLRARPDQRFVIAHGTSDRMTSAPASLQYAERLRAAGTHVARFELAGAGHALLDRPWLWHRFAVDVSLGLAGDRGLPPGVEAAFTPRAAGSLRLPLSDAAAR
jgi:alpha-beta hydrolase superfamily lysophospholipase